VGSPITGPDLLAGVRVLDMTDDRLESAGRLLADLGAEVIRAEPPGGAQSRRRPPFTSRGTSIFHAVRNANKRGITVPAGREGEQFVLDLLRQYDIWIRAERPGQAPSGPPADEARQRYPRLVVLTVSDFGLTGPYSGYTATDPVILALGSQLSRSGLPGHEPLIPPAWMAHETSAAQAVWAAMLAYYHRLRTGRGDHIDYSIYETALQVIDPPFGTIGTAAAATTSGIAIPAHRIAERGRPTRNYYPIFPCADGYVRLLVLARGQWRSMREWLGNPPQFMDDKFDISAERAAARDELYAAYGELFKGRGKFELAEEGQRRGVPVTPVLEPGEVIALEHFRARGAFVEGELSAGEPATLPSGFIEVDGARAGYRFRAPALGEHNAVIKAELAAAAPSASGTSGPRRKPGLPLDGIRVVDFGIIVFGAEVGRCFADMGAEVIKIENEAFPDTSRHAVEKDLGVSVSFALGHRNEKGLGVNMRTPRGADIIRRLVAKSDVVLSNFKPGTLDRLGLGYDVFKQVNPGIVAMFASGFGHTGPWRHWMGYGPLVRSTTGLTSLWRYHGQSSSFADPTTVYPDHYGARIAAVATLAGLIRAQRTAVGCDIRVSQAEVVINQLAEYFAEASIDPSNAVTDHGAESGSPWGVFPCLGDDEWCVITVGTETEWRSFVNAIARPELVSDPRFSTAPARIANREDLDGIVRSWTERLTPDDAMAALQKVSVPCGAMRRIPELESDRHLTAREFMTTVAQPGYAAPLPMANRPFRSESIAAPPRNPAPLLGEHTRQICRDVLGMTDEEVSDLLDAGILQAPSAGT
jgi:crotonobetainyl-CoA:carnitine CoA-transferase CaiB-like acyl-CoA transferase